MRAAPVTGDTADGRNDGALVILIKTEILLVDLRGHPEHMTGDILLRFGITGEIQFLRRAVGGGVTEITMYSERIRPGMHGLLQVIMTDILWQNFQVPFWRLIVRRTGRGHPNDQQGGEG